MEYLFADKISGLCNSTKNRNGKVCLWCLMQHEDFQTWETVETFKIPFENVWISLLRNHLNLKIIVFYVGLVLVRCFFNGNWKWISQSTDKVTRKKSPLTTFSFPLLLLSCPKISFLLFSRSTYSRRKIRKLLAALFSRNFLPFSPPPSCYVGALAFLLTYEIVVLVATEWKKWTVGQGYTTSFMSPGHLPSPSAHI